MSMTGGEGYRGVGSQHGRAWLHALACVVAMVGGIALSSRLLFGQGQDALFIDPQGVVRARSFEGRGTVPKGAILMWSGREDQLPPGWKLCDGQDGRPDLRGRFVLGSGRNRKVGDKDGAEQYTLTIAQMPTHNHGGTEVDGPHRHEIVAQSGDRAFGGGPVGPFSKKTQNETPHQVAPDNTFKGRSEMWTNTDGAHSHQIKDQGGGKPYPVMPPYFVLAFIIRVE